MNQEKICKAIKQNEQSYDGRYDNAYYVSDEEEIQLLRGTYLYTASSIIKHMQRYLLEYIKDDLDVFEIRDEDIFLYLKSKKIFKIDYNNLFERINEFIGEADYGQRSFYGEEEDFRQLRQDLKVLYKEFCSLKDPKE